jgi:protein involved in polysaccharide export with SLBB domain
MRVMSGLMAVAAWLGAQPAASQTVPTAPPPAPSASSQLQAYRLGIGDKLAVTVFGEDKIGGQVSVDPEGAITLPLAGRFVAEGRTIDELSEDIRSALANGYLRHPSIAVQVVSFRPCYILGEVNKPGQYDFSKGLTVMDAIAMAAGFTYRARKSAVFITHRGNAKEQRTPVTPSLMVVPGDTIRVGERYF